MIVGVGTDLIEIERIRKACVKEAFLTRVYTEEECRQAGGNAARLAGNFAVKEAVAKVFGTGFRKAHSTCRSTWRFTQAKGTVNFVENSVPASVVVFSHSASGVKYLEASRDPAAASSAVG